jgi:hypothetical protein
MHYGTSNSYKMNSHLSFNNNLTAVFGLQTGGITNLTAKHKNTFLPVSVCKHTIKRAFFSKKKQGMFVGKIMRESDTLF